MISGVVSVGLSIFPHAAFAVDCHLQFACNDIQTCMKEGVDNDRNRIYEGLRTHNGNLIWQGADACWTNKNQHNVWRADTAGCSDDDYWRAAQWATNSCGGSPP
jgi:hypothetical protein